MGGWCLFSGVVGEYEVGHRFAGLRHVESRGRRRGRGLLLLDDNDRFKPELVFFHHHIGSNLVSESDTL